MKSRQRVSRYGRHIYKRYTRTEEPRYYVRIVRRKEKLIYTSPLVKTIEEAITLRNKWLNEEVARYERRVKEEPARCAGKGAEGARGVV